MFHNLSAMTVDDELLAWKRLLDTLSASVPKYLRDDCGILFSGGVDSSVVAALAARHIPGIKLVTVGVEGSNDAAWAVAAAELLGMADQLHLKVIDPVDIESAIPVVMGALGSADPMSVSLGVPLYLACRAARTIDLGLLLAGQGADELLGGYHRYRAMALHGQEALHDAITADVSRLPLRDILRDNTVAEAAGMELAAPFLDPDVTEVGLSISPALKVREVKGELVGKYILRRMAEQLVPAEIAWRDKKAMQYGSGVWGVMGRLARQAGFGKQDKGYIRKYLYSVAEENKIELDVTS